MIPHFQGADRNPSEFQSFEAIPVYRRERFVSVLILTGFFCIPSLLWWACVICLTGAVYRRKVGPDGNLLRWSRWNKVAAAFILAIQAVSLIAYFVLWLQRLDQERHELWRSKVPISRKKDG